MRTGAHRMHGLDGTAGLQRTGLFTKSSSILIQRVAQLVLDSASISPTLALRYFRKTTLKYTSLELSYRSLKIDI